MRNDILYYYSVNSKKNQTDGESRVSEPTPIPSFAIGILIIKAFLLDKYLCKIYNQ